MPPVNMGAAASAGLAEQAIIAATENIPARSVAHRAFALESMPVCPAFY
jgi:hypothetical protein